MDADQADVGEKVDGGQLMVDRKGKEKTMLNVEFLIEK